MSPQRCSIILLVFLTTSGYCAKPRLEIIPSNGDIYLGKGQSFLCKSSVEATLKWLTSEDEEIENEEGKYITKFIDESTQSLHVIASQAEPDRIVTCQAESESGETSHTEIRLRVLQNPTFVKDVQVLKEFFAGSVAQLPCDVEGIPPPKITWSHNGKDVSNSPGRLSAARDGTLTIDKIQLSDAGVYYCQAYIRDRNEFAYKNVSVVVDAAPIVSFNESFPNITSKSNASFTCSVTGNPEPQIVWKKGEELVGHDGQKYILSSNGLHLSITDLAKGDGGAYTCYASNKYGEHNTTLILQVIDLPRAIGAGVITGIFLLIFLVTLLAVDLTCYRTRRSGFLMYLSTRVLGRPAPRVKLQDDIKKENSDKSHVVNISGMDA